MADPCRSGSPQEHRIKAAATARTHMMTEHDEVLRQLAAFHDGELNPADTSKIRAHLEDCASCRHQINDFKALDSALLQLEYPEPADSGIYLRALAQIRSQNPAEVAVAYRPRWIGWTAAAAAVVLMVITTGVLWQQNKPEQVATFLFVLLFFSPIILRIRSNMLLSPLD